MQTARPAMTPFSRWRIESFACVLEFGRAVRRAPLRSAGCRASSCSRCEMLGAVCSFRSCELVSRWIGTAHQPGQPSRNSAFRQDLGHFVLAWQIPTGSAFVIWPRHGPPCSGGSAKSANQPASATAVRKRSREGGSRNSGRQGRWTSSRFCGRRNSPALDDTSHHRHPERTTQIQ